MSEDQLERDVLGRAGIDRRSFIKKMVVGAAFAVPVVVSFDMLTSNVADGVTCTTANGTATSSGTSGSGTTGGAGGSRRSRGGDPTACGGTPDGGDGGAAGTPLKSDRALKTAVVPVAWS